MESVFILFRVYFFQEIEDDDSDSMSTCSQSSLPVIRSSKPSKPPPVRPAKPAASYDFGCDDDTPVANDFSGSVAAAENSERSSRLTDGLSDDDRRPSSSPVLRRVNRRVPSRTGSGETVSAVKVNREAKQVRVSVVILVSVLVVAL